MIQDDVDVETGAVAIQAAGIWTNYSDGDVTLAGGITNNGIIDFNGTTGDGILIRSTVDGTQHNWQGVGTFTLEDVDVKDQTVLGGTPTHVIVTDGTDSGHNINFVFGTGTEITGSIYDNIGGSKIAVSGNEIVVAVNDSTSLFIQPTDAAGDYVIMVSDLVADDVVGMYVNESNPVASLVTKAAASSDLTLNLYEDIVTLRSETGANSLDNADLRVIEQNTIIDPDKMLYGTDASNNVIVDGTYRLYQEAGTFDAIADMAVNNDLRVDGRMDVNDASVETTSASDLIVNGIVNLDHDNAILDISGNIDNNGTIDASGTSATIEAAGDVDFTGGAFTKGTGTFTFDGGAGQELLSNGQDMGDIEASGSGTDLVLKSGLDADDVTIGIGATVTDTESHTINVAGDWDNNGAFTSGNSLIVFDGAVAQTIYSGGVGAGEDFYNLRVANTLAAVTVSNEDLHILNNLEILTGAELIMAGDMDIDGDMKNAGTLDAANTLYIGGNWDNNGVFDANDSLVVFDGAGTQLINTGGIGTDEDFYDVQVSNTIGAVTVSDEHMKVVNTLTIDSGTVFTLANNAQVLVDDGTLVLNGTPVYAAVSALIYHNGTDYDYYGGTTGVATSDLIEGFGATDDVTIIRGTLPQDIDSDVNTLTINSGAIYEMQAGDLDIAGDMVNNGTLDAANTINIGGDWDNNGVFDSNDSLVIFDGTIAQTIYAGGIGSDEDFYDITISNTSAAVRVSIEDLQILNDLNILTGGELVMDGNMDINGDMTNAGTLDAYNTLSIAGDWDNNGTFTANDSLVVFDGITSATVETGADTFYDIEINKTGALTADDNLTFQTDDVVISNTLTITDGEMIQDDVDVETGAVAIQAAGIWTNYSDGDVTLAGGITNNGIIDFNGTTGDGILIRSTVDGTQHNWQGAGTFTLEDVDVKDQTCIGGTPTHIIVTDGTDSGHNINFVFGVGTLISGSFFDSISGSKIAEAGNTVVVGLNGSSSTFQAETTGSGDYLVMVSDLSLDDIVGMYIDEIAREASLVTKAAGAGAVTLDLYEDTLTLRNEPGSSTLDNTDMRILEQNAILNIPKLLYGTDASNNVIVNGAYELYQEIGTYAPAADLTISNNFRVDGTMNIGAETISINGGDMILNGIVNLDNDGSVLEIAGNMDLNGILDLSGTSANIEIGGDWDNDGVFNSGTSTVTFDGIIAQLINAGGMGAGNYFYDVIISNTTLPVVIGNEGMRAINDIIINTNAQFSMTGNDLDIGRDIIIDGTFTGANDITVVRNWDGTNGTFVPGNSNVTFYGNEATNILGSNTFNDLTCETAGKEIVFEAGSQQTVQGNFGITGTQGGGYIGLKSSSPNSFWFILVEGGVSVDYADVKDSHNLGDVIYTMTSKLQRTINWNNMRDEMMGTITQETELTDRYLDIELQKLFYRQYFVGLRENLALGENMCEIINVPIEYYNWEQHKKGYYERYLPSKMEIVMENMPDGTVVFRVVYK